MPALHEVAVIVMVVAVILCFVNMNSHLNRLEDAIGNMSNNMNSNSSLGEYFAEMQLQQKIANSLIESASVRYGNYNKEDHTADIIFQIVPKEVPKNAEVYLNFADQQLKLEEQKEAIYEGTIKLDIFQSYEDMVCTIVSEDGNRKTDIINTEDNFPELFDYEYGLWEEYLLNIDSEKDDYEISYEDGKSNVNISGSVYTFSRDESQNSLKSLKLCVSLDDKLIDQKELKTGEEVGFTLEKDYEIGSEQTMRIYVEATDSFGFRYVIPVEEWGISDNELMEQEAIIEDQIAIYDSMGKRMYHYDYE